MARTAWYLSLSRSWCVSLSLSSGWHVAAAADSNVAGRSRDGLARRLLLRYVDRRGGRAVDLKVRVARQGRELCGGLASVAQQALLGPGQRHFPSALGYLSIAQGGAVPLPGSLRGEAGHAPRALVLPAAPVLAGVSQERLEVVDQAVVAAVQEKQHGVLARGAPVLERLIADGLADRFPAEEVDILDWKEMLKRAQDLQLKLRKRLNQRAARMPAMAEERRRPSAQASAARGAPGCGWPF